ncbi:MAG TPA: sigma factor, partial [Polyangiaceae bacterium]|nr:sigma factor [Polyangiaceae bacterium]
MGEGASGGGANGGGASGAPPAGLGRPIPRPTQHPTPGAADGARYANVPPLEDTEARLVERLIARDERAFNDVVRAYERRIFALALRMLGDRAEAEDLAQEVF